MLQTPRIRCLWKHPLLDQIMAQAINVLTIELPHRNPSSQISSPDPSERFVHRSRAEKVLVNRLLVHILIYVAQVPKPELAPVQHIPFTRHKEEQGLCEAGGSRDLESTVRLDEAALAVGGTILRKPRVIRQHVVGIVWCWVLESHVRQCPESERLRMQADV